jgi:hypothetical protein
VLAESRGEKAAILSAEGDEFSHSASLVRPSRSRRRRTDEGADSDGARE